MIRPAYAHADQVYLDGALIYDRSDPAKQHRSDFMTGVQGGGR